MKVTISQLMGYIKKAIEMHFEQDIWIMATVISKKTSPVGHIYIEMADMSERGEILSQIKANLWKTDAVMVERKFFDGTGQKLKENMKVLVKAKVSFHEKFGLSVTIKDIEPSYTMGGIDEKLQKIRDRLKKEGVYEKNKLLDSPFDFFSIGVIAPKGAAGLEDYKKSMEYFEKSGIVEIEYRVATFQGDLVGKEIVDAIKYFETKELDAVLIIRGGGSKLDLDYLNSYEIASAIANSNHVYISGIGHEIDSTIIDEVVKIKCGTPSKVAEYIVGVLRDNARKMVVGMESIKKTSRIVLKEYEKQLEIEYGVVATSAKVKIQKTLAANEALFVKIKEISTSRSRTLKESFLQQKTQLILNAKASSKYKKKSLDETYKTIYMQSPQNTLKKGYAVIRDSKRKILVSAGDVSGKIIIGFKDGDVEAQVKK